MAEDPATVARNARLDELAASTEKYVAEATKTLNKSVDVVNKLLANRPGTNSATAATSTGASEKVLNAINDYLTGV